MAGEIREAAQRYKDRQDAAGLDADAISAGEDAVLAAFRRTIVGLDVDVDEVQEVAAAQAPAIAVALAIGMPPAAIATGQWVSGFIVGLLVADARQREEARS